MSRVAVILVACLTARGLAQDKVPSDLPAKIDKELPGFLSAGEVQAEIMEIVWPPRYLELSGKLFAAIAKDPQWWMEHVKKVEQGKPLPYDPRLGWTREEYDEFLKVAEQYSLKKKAETTLGMKSEGDKVYGLTGGKGLDDLTGIKIDVGHRLVITPFGRCETPREVHTPANHPFPWDGFQWRSDEDLDLAKRKGKTAEFSLGRFRNSEKNFLAYRVQGFHEAAPVQVEIYVRYSAGVASAVRVPELPKESPGPSGLPKRPLDPWANGNEGVWYRTKSTIAGEESYCDVGLKSKNDSHYVLVRQSYEKNVLGESQEDRIEVLRASGTGSSTISIDGRDYECEIKETPQGEKKWVALEGRVRGAVLRNESARGILAANRLWDHKLTIKGRVFDCVVIEAELRTGKKTEPIKAWFSSEVPIGYVREERQGRSKILIDFGSDWSKRPPFPGQAEPKKGQD